LVTRVIHKFKKFLKQIIIYNKCRKSIFESKRYIIVNEVPNIFGQGCITVQMSKQNRAILRLLMMLIFSCIIVFNELDLIQTARCEQQASSSSQSIKRYFLRHCSHFQKNQHCWILGEQREQQALNIHYICMYYSVAQDNIFNTYRRVEYNLSLEDIGRLKLVNCFLMSGFIRCNKLSNFATHSTIVEVGFLI